MDRAEVRILKQMHKESLGGFLQGLDGMRLPAQLVRHLGGEHVHGDFAHEARKGQFADEEVEGALVFADFFEGDGAGFVAVAAALGGGVSGWVVLVFLFLSFLLFARVGLVVGLERGGYRGVGRINLR